MPDINLLNNNSHSINFSRFGLSLLVKILTGILVLVGLYYGYLWISLRSNQKELVNLQTKTSQAETEAMSSKDRAELITRQGQLQNVDVLIKDHVYWSQILPELARVTVNSATYATINGDTKGMLNVTVSAPTFEELDKYLQVFNLPEYSTQFSDVRIVSLNKAQEGASVKNQMQLQLKFNPVFIHKTLK